MGKKRKKENRRANNLAYVKCLCTACGRPSNQRKNQLNIGVRCYSCGGNIVAKRYAI